MKTPPKIKVGVNLPRKAKYVPETTPFGRVGCSVEMRQAKPVFKANKLLQYFWTVHPTKAAIDATFKFLVDRGLIRENPGSPVLPQGTAREEKLAMIRAWYARRDQDVAFDK